MTLAAGTKQPSHLRHQPGLVLFKRCPFLGILRMRVDVHRDVGRRVAQNSLSRFRGYLFFRDQHGCQRAAENMTARSSGKPTS